MKNITYTFNYLQECNFCHAKKSQFKTLGKRLNTSQGKNPRNKTGITTTVVRCKNCGLVFSNPQPIPESIQDHYGIPPETYWKESYFKIDENYFTGEIEWFKRIENFEPGMKSLDIGAGLGKAMIALQKAGFDSYGLEPSVPFYERAVSQMGIDSSKLKLTSVEDVEYPDIFFDFITFGVVLEHLYDPSMCLAKALKWLKPKGLLHIEVPSPNWLVNKMINVFYKLQGLDYVGNISPMHEPFHLYEFSLKSFVENSNILDYEIADYGYYVCPTYLPSILDKPLRYYMKKKNAGMQLVVWMRKV